MLKYVLLATLSFSAQPSWAGINYKFVVTAGDTVVGQTLTLTSSAYEKGGISTFLSCPEYGLLQPCIQAALAAGWESGPLYPTNDTIADLRVVAEWKLLVGSIFIHNKSVAVDYIYNGDGGNWMGSIVYNVGSFNATGYWTEVSEPSSALALSMGWLASVLIAGSAAKHRNYQAHRDIVNYALGK